MTPTLRSAAHPHRPHLLRTVPNEPGGKHHQRSCTAHRQHNEIPVGEAAQSTDDHAMITSECLTSTGTPEGQQTARGIKR